MEKGGRLAISTREKDGFIRIAFADTGPGIPKEYLPLIFDPFYTTKPVGQGTGLGLSICDRIISQAGQGDHVHGAAAGGDERKNIKTPLTYQMCYIKINERLVN